VASHVRLFKKARYLLVKARKEAAAAGGDNGKFMPTSVPDLESLFFDCEVAMEDGQVCRDLVCTIHQEEVDFLQVRINYYAFLDTYLHSSWFCRPFYVC
jgi:hypothetical protein